MTNSWMNADGEPIMDGAAWRFEQQLDLDSRDDYYADRFYDDDNEPPYVDPEDCDHPDTNGKTRWTVECAHCESYGLVVVNNFDGWTWDEEIEKVVVWTVY